MPVVYDFGSTQFDDAVRAATRRAFAEMVAAGLPIFYIDGAGLNVMERADGRRFEIRLLPSAPSGENYEIIRELTAYTALRRRAHPHGNRRSNANAAQGLPGGRRQIL